VSGILVVDDDETVGDVVLRYLAREGLEGRQLTAGGQVLATIANRPPDLLVLDVMLPDADGIDLCRRVRETHPCLPLILLTARTAEEDRIAGLSAGADDYVMKPFSPRELVLRIKSVLRRAGTEPPPAAPDAPAVWREDGLTLDTAARTLTVAGTDVTLTAREFNLLCHFVRHRGEVLSRRQLLTDVWQWDFGDESTVTVHVRRLREKVETDPSRPGRLVTVWGAGYRWDPVGEASWTA
jgi:DNA-binding response OmpR family regulator